MKASALFLIGVVVMLHCAAIGALVFIQGCGTTRTGTPPPEPVMPPTAPAAVQYPAPPALPPPPVYKPTEAPAQPAGTTEYVVRSGDSIGRIAKDYGVSMAELTALNKITDPNKLRAGQKILLPGEHTIKPPAPKRTVSKPKPAAAPAAAAASGATVYVVQRGDSLGKIAKRHGVTIAALKQANNLTGDKLMIDQKLAIPEPGAKPAPVPAAVPPDAAAPATLPPLDIPAAMPPEAAAPVPMGDPAVAAGAPATELPVVADSAPVAAGADLPVTHVVGPTEDLASIAKLYAVTVNELATFNQLTSLTVQPGQKLRIP